VSGDILQPIPHRNRNVLIQDRLKEYIIQNRLQPGDKLPTEEQLAERLGVSRAAIREALRSLEAIGVIEAHHGVGRVVREFSFAPVLENLSYGLLFQNQSILQITDIRVALDSFFIEPAIQNLSPTDLETLESLVAEMRQLEAQGLPISAPDHRFHELLYERCGNPLALQLFEIAWRARERALDQDLVFKEIPPGTAREHAEILAAIRQKDVERARQVMIAHHWNIKRRFAEQIHREALRNRKANAPAGKEEL
jgi:DNA-binding FadR family transcriptional regulator